MKKEELEDLLIKYNNINKINYKAIKGIDNKKELEYRKMLIENGEYKYEETIDREDIENEVDFKIIETYVLKALVQIEWFNGFKTYKFNTYNEAYFAYNIIDFEKCYIYNELTDISIIKSGTIDVFHNENNYTLPIKNLMIDKSILLLEKIID